VAKTKRKVVLVVDAEICKGCGLCVAVCPHQAIGLVKETINTRGFHPAGLVRPEECTACAQCALMCPDACIRITTIG
jgi:2-oxoglutarate ferredoxin oxidoreductase subunit delta